MIQLTFRRVSIVVAICLVWLFWHSSTQGSQPISILLTADTEGRVGLCQDCPGRQGLGGLARRATLIKRLRKENSAVLLVDAGNALYGADSMESQGKVMVAAYNALGYDAVNLSYRDFRLGKSITLRLLKEAKFAVLSANLFDEKSNKLLAKPYVVKKVGGKKLAFIGLTQSPAGLKFLPHLKEQLARIRFQPPVDALAKWLPRAKAAADRVILLYYGSLGGLRPIREKFGSDLAAILTGGLRPSLLLAKTTPPAIGAEPFGQRLTHVRWADIGSKKPAEVSQIPVEPSMAVASELEALLAKYIQARKPIQPPQRQKPTDADRKPPEVAILKHDLLDLKHGAKMVTATSEYDKRWRARFLLDGTHATGWCSAKGKAYPNTFVVELPGGYRIWEFVIDNTNVQEKNYPGISARQFELHASTSGSKEGYHLVLAGEAAQGKRKKFKLEKPAETRWLALVVLSNWGNSSYTEVMELEAYGEALGDAETETTRKEKDTPKRVHDEKQAGSGTADKDLGKLRIDLDKGPVYAVLTADYKKTPLSPTTKIPEGRKKVYLVVWSKAKGTVRVFVTLYAVDAEGMKPNAKLFGDSYVFARGERRNFGLRAGLGKFSPGKYRVDLQVEGGPLRSIPFEVVSLLPSAEVVGESDLPGGFNIALSALGGTIESISSQFNDSNWAAKNLIDGYPVINRRRGSQYSSGWQSGSHALPVEIVFSFFQERKALVTAVVFDIIELVDKASDGTILEEKIIPKHVEVWTSIKSPTEGFSRIAGARLLRVGDVQMIRFSPTPAKYLKLKLLSNYGDKRTGLGEFRIIEANSLSESILDDLPKNLASPALGGTIVWFTSQSKDNPLSHLVGGKVSKKSGWISGAGPYGSASYLPQEFVFSFNNDRAPLIEKIVLNPMSGPKWGGGDHDSYWPKLIAVSVSAGSLPSGFEEVGRFSVAREPREQAFPINRRARFVKLKILENYGGERTSLGEVKIIEGSGEDYQTVLLTPRQIESRAISQYKMAIQEEVAADFVENEPNDSIPDSGLLEFGRFTKGAIDPLGEDDYFGFEVTDPEARILTLDLVGLPNIRTSLTLLDSDEKPLKRFDPTDVTTRRMRLSWSVAPGKYSLKVNEPPASTVLVWDTSGSMRGRTQDLQLAVEAFLDQLRPEDRVNLIRFSEKTEVLLPKFTGDRGRIKAAIQNKFIAEGSTALYDAFAKGIDLLEQVDGRRAMVVFTDGMDTASRLDTPAFWKRLKDSHIRIYTIGLGWDLTNYDIKTGSTGQRTLAYAAEFTNGRFFMAPGSDELPEIYRQISNEINTPARYFLRPSVSRGYGSLIVKATGERIPAVSAPPQFELILDASGSMKRKMGGRRMIDVAKEVSAEILKSLPDDVEVALRVFGHRIREGSKGDCKDTELLYPLKKLDKSEVLSRLESVRALGTTPIAYTLKQVANDLGKKPGEKVVILITDGKEECGGDPAKEVSSLVSQGYDVKVNIVGFALKDKTYAKEMERVAGLSDGSFYNAKDSEELRTAIEQSLRAPYDVLDATGEVVSRGRLGGGSLKLPEGVYTIRVHKAEEPLIVPNVEITLNQVTELVLKKEGQEIGTQILGS